MVCSQGIRALQRPNGNTLGSTGLIMKAGGVGEAASRRTQQLPGTTKVPTGGVL